MNFFCWTAVVYHQNCLKSVNRLKHHFLTKVAKVRKNKQQQRLKTPGKVFFNALNQGRKSNLNGQSQTGENEGAWSLILKFAILMADGLMSTGMTLFSIFRYLPAIEVILSDSRSPAVSGL